MPAAAARSAARSTIPRRPSSATAVDAVPSESRPVRFRELGQRGRERRGSRIAERVAERGREARITEQRGRDHGVRERMVLDRLVRKCTGRGELARDLDERTRIVGAPVHVEQTAQRGHVAGIEIRRAQEHVVGAIDVAEVDEHGLAEPVQAIGRLRGDGASGTS